MAKGQKDEAEQVKAEVKAMADETGKSWKRMKKTFAERSSKTDMMVIPNIIDSSPCRSVRMTAENVEIEALRRPRCSEL